MAVQQQQQVKCIDLCLTFEFLIHHTPAELICDVAIFPATASKQILGTIYVELQWILIKIARDCLNFVDKTTFSFLWPLSSKKQAKQWLKCQGQPSEQPALQSEQQRQESYKECKKLLSAAVIN